MHEQYNNQSFSRICWLSLTLTIYPTETCILILSLLSPEGPVPDQLEFDVDRGVHFVYRVPERVPVCVRIGIQETEQVLTGETDLEIHYSANFLCY